jgi:hypothetical protein
LLRQRLVFVRRRDVIGPGQKLLALGQLLVDGPKEIGVGLDCGLVNQRRRFLGV